MQKIGNFIEQVIRYTLIVTLLVLVGAITLQVFNRFVIHYSMPILQWIIILTFAWLNFLGSAIAIRSDSHFYIDILVRSFSSHAIVKILNVLIAGIILVCIFTIIFTGWGFMQLGFIKRSPATGYSMVWTYASVFVSGILMAFFAVEKIIKHICARERK